jgi:hypothetical protein
MVRCEQEKQPFMEFCGERHAEVRYLGFARRDEQVVAKIARIAPVSERGVARKCKDA